MVSMASERLGINRYYPRIDNEVPLPFFFAKELPGHLVDNFVIILNITELSLWSWNRKLDSGCWSLEAGFLRSNTGIWRPELEVRSGGRTLILPLGGWCWTSAREDRLGPL